ncbi:uncharacterized protein PV09_03272 [Verruconis gallopava]|uniref:RlpA-like protein double-psi beta-barrel domain-containing protein n=1 Tax=Verruconis gallopava TaxID=253628 RepID=A0A0D2B4F3_9PEZI|nr:uncharacterized protein PV09_03272 [Verruconis gallopava]KIW06104.1 hypothetical protein PV09_03272 [Verruconis gallopava]
MSIPRKPVPSLSIANGSPKLENVPEITPSVSEQDLAKDVEKNPVAETTRRASSEEDLAPPVPAYKRVVTGFGDFGSGGYAFEKVRSFHFRDFKPSTKNASKRLSAQSKRLSQRYGQELGGQKRYFGLTRRSFYLSVLALVLIVLAVAIGLGVGLKRIHRPQNLPLPSNQEVHTGDLTYYEPGLGACGITNTASDSIVAISHLVFDAAQTGSDPNQNPLCGKKIRVSRYNEQVGAQRSVDVTVTDRCVGCKATDLDVTTSVFDQLADQDAGRVLATWAWLNVDL